MLLCISFSCKKQLSPHLLQGILKEGWGLGRNGRWVAGGGRLESPYFIDWLFPNNNKSLLSRVLFTPVSFIVSLFLQFFYVHFNVNAVLSQSDFYQTRISEYGIYNLQQNGAYFNLNVKKCGAYYRGKNAADFYICIEHCSNAKN